MSLEFHWTGSAVEKLRRATKSDVAGTGRFDRTHAKHVECQVSSYSWVLVLRCPINGFEIETKTLVFVELKGLALPTDH